MRTIGTALLVLVATGMVFAPEHATARKPKAAHAVSPESQPKVPTAESATTGPLRAAYNAMSLSDRVAIQSDLIWTSDYNGVTDGEVGDRTIAAVKAFQRRNGGKETGILNAQEREKLADAAQPREEQVGWRLLDDPATGVQMGLPSKLVPQASIGQTGSHWQSARGEMQVNTFKVAIKGTTLEKVLQQQKEIRGRNLQYSVVKPDFFVISGVQNGVKKFYVRAHANNDEVRGIIILYDRAMEGIVEKVVIAMSSAFAPFPTGEIAIEPRRTALQRRKVEYGTGIVVSDIGHILTDRQTIDGCSVVVVSGLGNAERIAEDKASDLALLRVHGAHDLAPVSISSEREGATDLTLVGIADPQIQGGGDSVSRTQGHVIGGNRSGNLIEPTPKLGFSGAAAIDSEGLLAGMVELKPSPAGARSDSAQAILVPVATVREFLGAQNVAPVRPGAHSATISVVRVICVRG
jgi:peptidoglycan hydrolase-like protein with peptidoglycan-binding domain